LGITELLDRLKDIDSRVFKLWFNDYDIFGLDQWQLDCLQGHLQRAIDERGWTWSICRLTPECKSRFSACINVVEPGYDGDYYNTYHEYCITEKEGESPVEALLECYLEAVINEGV
jgi:hypothetical protein